MGSHASQISVLGVPTSAGSHNPGQEKAPAAWRAAGLIEALRAAGLDVEDRGDLAVEPFRPVSPVDGLRDADRVAGIAASVAASVAEIRAAGRVPLVLGGDCTITLGVLAGSGVRRRPGVLRRGRGPAYPGTDRFRGGGHDGDDPHARRRVAAAGPARLPVPAAGPGAGGAVRVRPGRAGHLPVDRSGQPAPVRGPGPGGAGRPGRRGPAGAAVPGPPLRLLPGALRRRRAAHRGCSRWPTSRTSPGSGWTRPAPAWTSSPAGRSSAGWSSRR